MQLKQGTLLQGGKYRIEKALGQGGFGITYLAENTMLEGMVAIKEFFFKEYCNRDETTSHVTIPTEGNRELVERFKQKFIKEARTIFKLNHPNIVRILDIFEENGTAYYVMDYIEGESLGDRVKLRGAIPEAEAIGYIKEVASALSYIHGKSINHLDIKPGNIMKRREDGKVLLIDFGVAKQYDAETSEGTTTTPVGISHGYSPAEQYRKNGVQSFSPQSDVYALAATFYKLLTGVTPPEAMEIQDEGLPLGPMQNMGISPATLHAIETAMQSYSKRTQSVDAFVADLHNNNGYTCEEPSEDTENDIEATVVTETPKPISKPVVSAKSKFSTSKQPIILAVLVGILGICLGVWIFGGNGGAESNEAEGNTPVSEQIAQIDSTKTEEPTVAPTPAPASTPVAENKQEAVEAAAYYVGFTCNVLTATLYVDGKEIGSAWGTYPISTGRHKIKVTAEGYKDHAGTFTVNSKSTSYEITMIEEPKATTGKHNGHEWVDLGLPSGTKWATMNVGASSPSDYGRYFAWGETSPKSSYDWSNLKYCLDNSVVKLSKYVTDSKYGTVDGKKELDLSDDAAYANWGSGWRMPSASQIDELRSNCNYTWTTMNGKNGYKVTSKKNGNSIFLPAAGYRSGASSCDVGSHGYYWSRSLNTGHGWGAYSLYFSSSYFYSYNNLRLCGFCVRPVRVSE